MGQHGPRRPGHYYHDACGLSLVVAAATSLLGAQDNALGVRRHAAQCDTQTYFSTSASALCQPYRYAYELRFPERAYDDGYGILWLVVGAGCQSYPWFEMARRGDPGSCLHARAGWVQ